MLIEKKNILNAITGSISQKLRLQIVLFLLIIGAPFFFLGGPGAHGSRSFLALWDLGHVLFFFLTSLLLSKLIRYRFKGLSLFASQRAVFLLIFVLGSAVEILQMFFDGRSPDPQDVLRNQLGCLIALAFFACGKRHLRNKFLFQFQTLVIILVLLVLVPLGRAVVDECIALNQFPLLSDFETPFEADRWKEDALVNVSEDVARHGHHSLKVQLTTNLYSGVELIYFPKNWKNYENLYISVFFPDEGQLKLVCRVHDSEHNNEYIDRFNKNYLLEKGWNDLVIPFTDIENGPEKRLLNMKRIESLMVFVSQQDKEKIIYIDHVYLGE